MDELREELFSIEGTKLLEYKNPNGVTAIGEGAFKYFRALESITIPNGVTNIDNNAFFACEVLKKSRDFQGLQKKRRKYSLMQSQVSSVNANSFTPDNPHNDLPLPIFTRVQFFCSISAVIL